MKSKVYFIRFEDNETEESAGLKARKIFLSSGILSDLAKNDIVGIKIHFGEKGGKNFIRPLWAKGVADEIKKRSSRIFFTDTNTLYVGSRSNSVNHSAIASEHGFSIDKIGYPVIIADGVQGRNFVKIDIAKKHFSSVKIASDFIDADAILGMAHMTGHFQTGFGAAIKNIGMGCASRAGKLEQHSSVLPEVTKERCSGCGLCTRWCPSGAIEIVEKKAVVTKNKCIGCGECTVVCKFAAIEITWNETVQNLQEKIAEYAYGVHRAAGKKTGYMNFLDRITRNCDCMAKDEPYITKDIGILASNDPVSIDRASIDLMNQNSGLDLMRSIYSKVDYNVQLNYGAQIGLGNNEYDLIEIK